jgi:LPXTG-site transpeptidase (sortase) family protein
MTGGPGDDRRERLRKAALPGLLLLGCLLGIGIVMTSLLMILDPGGPVQQGGASGVAEPAARTGDYTPPTVGPGGLGRPLAEAAPSAPPPAPAVQPAQDVATTKRTRPRRLLIPEIGVNAPLGSVGVTKTKEIEVPPLTRPQVAAWYRYGPVPGQLGPAIIVGHVNTRRGPAVFSRLRELKRGDKIQVRRSDGVVAEFTVDGVEQVGKTTFPTSRVYGNSSVAALRLITCGGVFNAKARSYTDNIIVYATLSGTSTA